MAVAETHVISYDVNTQSFTPDAIAALPGDTVVWEIDGTPPPGMTFHFASGTDCQADGFFFNPPNDLQFEVPFHAGSIPFFCDPFCNAQGVIHVDTGGDTLHVPKEHATIASAIDAANDGDLIQIASGTYYEHDLQLSAKAITIRGELNADGLPAVTIDAQQKGRVLTCTGPAAARPLIESIAFTGGAIAGTGGALVCDAEWLLVRNCTFIGNQSFIKGGAIYASCNPNPPMGGPGPSFAGCTITGNTAAIGGGGIFSSNNRAQLRHCIVGQNSTESGAGGGVSFAGKVGGGMSVYSSIVCGNFPDQLVGVWPDDESCVAGTCQTDDDGSPIGCQIDDDGILYVPSEYETLASAFATVIEGNTIVIEAGTYLLEESDELYAKGMSISIIGETNADGTPAVIIDGQGAAYGIGIGYGDGTSVIENLHITRCLDPIVLQGCVANVTNCVIQECYAYYGAIVCSSTISELKNCVITGNQGTFCGGVQVIDNAGAATSLTMIDCVIEGNYGTYPFYAVGGVSLYNGHTVMSGCSVRDNQGGGLGGVGVLEDATATIVHSTVCGNIGYDSDPTQVYGEYTDKGGNTISEECPVACAGDIDGDGVINVNDLLMLIGAWGTCDGCPEDIDENGVVNVNDLLIAIAAWGTCE